MAIDTDYQATVHRRLAEAEGGYAKLLQERDRLRDALAHYADRSRWRKEVIDSYSGECSLFDWPGDLADEPWEIAEKALQ